MKNRKIILFLLILFVGTVLRFYQLGSVPDSLNWDEVSYGYNAYSILQSGKDEYGVSYPTIFRAFGEYKQPVLMYLDVISIGIFGLSSFAVRFPSALFGSLSIISVYFLVRELFRKQVFSESLSYLSMLFFAISPWSVQFSRAAFEANVALFFIISGAYLFIRSVHEKRKNLFFLATFVLSLSLYTYLSAKLFVPLFFFALLVYGYKYLNTRRVLVAAVVVFFVFCNSFWLFDSRTTARGAGVLFTSAQSEILKDSIEKLENDRASGNKFGELIHNRRVVYVQKFITNYLSHFNPGFLFIDGDSVSRHHPPGMGQLYLISLPFILLGIFYLVSSQYIAASLLLFFWLLIAPLASSLTNEAPHALRSLIFLPTWHIFEAAGVIYLLSIIKRSSLQKIAVIMIAVLFLGNFGYFFHQYYMHTNTVTQKDWQYGYKETVEYINKYNNSDKRIIFANSFEQPYIFYLFYTKYDPKKYIASGSSWRTRDRCYTIDNAYFGSCLDKLRKGDIYLSNVEGDLLKARELKKIMYQNGKTAAIIYQYE